MPGGRAVPPKSSASHAALEIAGYAMLALVVLSTIVRTWHSTWDFQTFYWAASAARRGLDPYRLEALSAIAGTSIALPFLYPPITLALFLPFTWLSVSSAAVAWLALKLGLAAGLVTLWRAFLPSTRPLTLLVVAVLGFNASLLWDLRTGNLSVVEQLALWLGFTRYVEGRRRSFVAFVILGSVFKLLPIAFLALLLVPSRERRSNPGLAAAGLALFAAIVVLPAWLGPAWAHGYLGGQPAERPYGERNPSVVGILDMAFHGAPPPGSGPDRALIGWGLWSAGLLALSATHLRRVWDERNPRQAVFVAAILFALLSPRMMIYSYLLLVPPAIALVREVFPAPRARALALALVVVQGVFQVLPSAWRVPLLQRLTFPEALLVANFSYFATLALWLAWLVVGRRRARR